MESMLHPGPFRAEERGGGHVVVDARGEVVARVEGEWPHRTADAITRALNGSEAHAEELEEFRSLLADHGCDDAEELDHLINHLQARPAQEDWTDLKSEKQSLLRDLASARSLIQSLESELGLLRSSAGAPA